MAALKWDRLFETCVKRNATDALLLIGSPPLLRLHENWRSLQTEPLTASDLRTMVVEIMKPKPVGEADGYSYIDVRYSDLAGFRVMAFGYPDVTALVVSRDIPPMPESVRSFLS